MPIGYKPDPSAGDNRHDPLRPGTFDFKVDAAMEKTFSTGTPGLAVKLLVAYDGRDVPCFVNLFYEKATWKLKTFIDCIGLDYDNPPELYEIEGRHGRARFKVKDDGYFDVAAFLDDVDAVMDPQSGAEMRNKHRADEYKPPAPVDDDVPF